jgi:hypothetical protein
MACNIPAASMTLLPPFNTPPDCDIQKMMAFAPVYSFEFIPPRHSALKADGI